MLLQIRRSVGGSCASTFQKLLTQSVFRVAMMSSYTARTGADALAYSIGSRLAVISSTSGGAPRLWPKPSMSEGRPKQRAASPPSRYTAAGISSGEVPMRARSPSMRITAAAALTALVRAALAVAALAAAGAAGAAPTAKAAVAAQPVQRSAAGMHTFESLTLSPDGARIASVEVERAFGSPACTWRYESHWPPDGRAFVGTAAKGDCDANWWIAELDAFDIGGGRRRIASFEVQMSVPRVAADGRTVRFIGGLMS